MLGGINKGNSTPEAMSEDFCFVFFKTGFLCSPGCSGTCSVDQAGLELKRSACFCLCLLSAGITGVCHHAQHSRTNFDCHELGGDTGFIDRC